MSRLRFSSKTGERMKESLQVVYIDKEIIMVVER